MKFEVDGNGRYALHESKRNTYLVRETREMEFENAWFNPSTELYHLSDEITIGNIYTTYAKDLDHEYVLSFLKKEYESHRSVEKEKSDNIMKKIYGDLFTHAKSIYSFRINLCNLHFLQEKKIKSGLKVSKFINEAIAEKLQKDGYL